MISIILNSVRKYKAALLSTAFIVIFIAVTWKIFGQLHPVAAAAAGLLSAIPGKMFWQAFMSPVLVINTKPEYRIFHPLPPLQIGLAIRAYRACRINVENKGRSTATNCKAYIVSKNGKGRVCWVVPKERPNATINPKDSEGLDFCAFYHGESSLAESLQIIAPTEEGWAEPERCRDLYSLTECEVRITADNAESVSAKVQLDLQRKTITLFS